MSDSTPVPLSSPPKANQLVQHAGKTYTTVKEGLAYILIPPNTRTSVNPKVQSKPKDVSDHPAGDGGEQAQSVFFNPIQQFNRDLSVLAIRAFGREFCERKRVKWMRANAKAVSKKERKKKHRKNGGDDAQKEVRDENGATGVSKTVLDGVDEIDFGSGKPLKRKMDRGDLSIEEPGSTKRQRVGGTGLERESPEESIVGAVGAEQSAEEIEAIDHLATNGTGEEANAEQAPSQQPAPDPEDTQQADAGDEMAAPTWRPKFRILDALSATGLRALRYAAEIPFASSVVANDMERKAVESIRTNVHHNQQQERITVNLGNAIGYMYSIAFPPTGSHGPSHVSSKFDVIDLDPYGTAAPFIDAALQALNDGGLLCVTCTDSGVFASCGYSEKTFALYGGLPIKGNHSHEGGLRLIIQSVAATAAKYGLAIEPLLSLSIDFYVRIFIRVTKSPADVKFLSGKSMVVYGCDAGCGAWSTQMLGRNVRQTGKDGNSSNSKNPTFLFKHTIAQGPSADRLCEHCGSKMHVAGPMWAGPLHNAAFVETLLNDASAADKDVYQTKQRLEGMLNTALEELTVIPSAESLWTCTTSSQPNSASTSNIPSSSSSFFSNTPPEVLDPNPFFFIPSALAKVLHCVAPPEAAIKGALRHAGYRATRSHCKPGSVKTDAPWSVVWEIMREWVRVRAPVKEGALREGQPGWRVMFPDGQKDNVEQESDGAGGEKSKLEVVFDESLGKDKPGKRLVRYQQNPRENWGPMSKAKGSR